MIDRRLFVKRAVTGTAVAGLAVVAGAIAGAEPAEAQTQQAVPAKASFNLWCWINGHNWYTVRTWAPSHGLKRCTRCSKTYTW